MDILSVIDNNLGILLVNVFESVLHPGGLDKSVVFVPESVARRYHAEKAGDNIYDFISFYRVRTELDWTRLRLPAAKKGLLTGQSKDGSSYVGYKGVPVLLGYDIIYWSKYKLRCNEFIQKALFWQFNNPQIYFKVADEYPVGFDWFIRSLREEVSDWFDQGRYFRVFLSMEVQAHLVEEILNKVVREIHLDIYEQESGILLKEVIIK